MKQLVILLSGKKQSGKNTLANFITGLYLQYTNQIEKFDITKNGLLEIQNQTFLKSYVIPEGNFAKFPFKGIKLYGFADPLKRFCIDVLGFSYAQCYGSDSDKNTYTNCSWKNISEDIRKQYNKIFPEEAMTAREVMQILATDMIRSMDPDAWARGTFNLIKRENQQLAIITDTRFPNEINMGHNLGAKSIRLTRNPCARDLHPSEIALDIYEGFSFILDNPDDTIKSQGQKAFPIIVQWFKEIGIQDNVK